MGDRYHSDSARRVRGEVVSDLRSRLREAADAHRPDRELVLARVERGMAERDGRSGPRGGRGGHRWPIDPAPWVRVVGVTAALVGTLGVAVAVGLATDGVREPGRTVAASPDPAAPQDRPSPTAPGNHRGAALPTTGEHGAIAGPSTPSATSGSSSAIPPGPPDPRRGNHRRDGYLWSDGSVSRSGNEFWAQSDVTLKTGRPMTRLTVVLRVVRTAGVSSTGAWSTLPGGDCRLSVTKSDHAVVYRWTLKAGRTVPVGTFVFAGQYNHARGSRNTGDDGYAAHGYSPSGAVEVRGGF
jgi:hypothetical protein